jgi:uncharacterized membrane protein YGL010W
MPLGDDLDAAVAEGIVTDAQAVALREFAAERDKRRAVARGHEERFRFMRGFNDFFFAVGVLMLGFGVGFFAGTSMAGNLVAAAIIWALAELLAGRMRLVLPTMLLACFFVAFLGRAIPIDAWLSGLPPAPDGPPYSIARLFFSRTFWSAAPAVIVTKALLASAAAAVFYLRFRLPFALLLVAGGLVVAFAGGSRQLVEPTTFSFVLLGCGAAVFAAAMAFDMSDRERLTRRADCAFWLHLLAAPLIVHSLIFIVTGKVSAYVMPGHIAVTITIVVALLAVVAIAIDRRALLVSALGYLGAVIAYAIVTAGVGGERLDFPVVIFATLAALGALVIALGVGWLPLRRVLFRLLPRTLLDRLPPAAIAA